VWLEKTCASKIQMKQIVLVLDSQTINKSFVIPLFYILFINKKYDKLCADDVEGSIAQYIKIFLLE
jgi:hypothetical protein